MRIAGVRPLAGYVVEVHLDDGTTRAIDISRFIGWGSVFAPVRNDRSYFEQVFVDPIGETVTWPNGADIAPGVLLGEAEPANPRHIPA